MINVGNDPFEEIGQFFVSSCSRCVMPGKARVKSVTEEPTPLSFSSQLKLRLNFPMVQLGPGLGKTRKKIKEMLLLGRSTLSSHL